MLHQFRFDGHGHSKASDGSDTPETIITTAINKKLDILALTDHNNLDSLDKFIEISKRVNEHNLQLLTINGFELSCKEGDLLIYFPTESATRQCIKRFSKPSHRPLLKEAIGHYIDMYDCYFVIPHPQSIYISSVSMEKISELLKELPPHQHFRIGIEVYNWMSQIFIWQRPQQEASIKKFATQANLAMFGGTDYHRAKDIGNGYSVMYMENLTLSAFFQAFKNRQSHANETHKLTISELASLVSASYHAEMNTLFGNPSFRIPKTG